MDIIKVSLIGMSGVFLSIILKERKAEFAQIVILCVAILIFAFVSTKLGIIVSTIKTLASYVNIEEKYLVILLKMTGITYVAEFAASLCKDAGNQAVATQIEIFAKLSLLAVSLPVVTALLETIGSI
ncbi:MAG: SpoIIIAC/SpoIIIAD family protein [Butyrivibrio sp.]